MIGVNSSRSTDNRALGFVCIQLRTPINYTNRISLLGPDLVIQKPNVYEEEKV